jgi:hypothetical protein
MEKEFIKNYLVIVQRTLTCFQYIETSLRMYIDQTYKAIKIELKSKITFKYCEKDIEDLSLGRLVKIFDKLNSNTDLINRLKKLVPFRNFIAHSALLLDLEMQQDDIFLKKNYTDIEKDLKKCQKCLADIHIEISNIIDKYQKI